MTAASEAAKPAPCLPTASRPDRAAQPPPGGPILWPDDKARERSATLILPRPRWQYLLFAAGYAALAAASALSARRYGQGWLANGNLSAIAQLHAA
ncbi:MAG: hypothetical protein ACLPUO_06450 [Streptosporangiaceae bacterium]